MKPTALFLTVAVLGVGFAPASSDPPKDEPKYAPIPWHLVDTWWDLGKETPFESLAVDVTGGKRRAGVGETCTSPRSGWGT